MAHKKYLSVTKADNFHDVTIKGETVRVEAGQFLAMDENHNLEILNEDPNETQEKPVASKRKGKKPVDEVAENNVVHVATMSKEDTEAVLDDDNVSLRMDVEPSPDVPLTKELNDEKIYIGNDIVPTDDPHFPPSPTKPAVPRDPRPEEDQPITQDDIKGA